LSALVIGKFESKPAVIATSTCDDLSAVAQRAKAEVNPLLLSRGEMDCFCLRQGASADKSLRSQQ
jgi:hypothetical protein